MRKQYLQQGKQMAGSVKHEQVVEVAKKINILAREIEKSKRAIEERIAEWPKKSP